MVVPGLASAAIESSPSSPVVEFVGGWIRWQSDEVSTDASVHPADVTPH